jgi:hypothetical protein
MHADTKANLAVEYIGATTGWMGIGFTEYPGNMLGSKAIIVTDTAPGGMGLFSLDQKAAAGIKPVTGTEPGFKISEACSAFSQIVSHSVCLCPHFMLCYAVSSDASEMTFHNQK